MAVEIIEHRQDGGATVVHREMNHGGTVLGNQVTFVTSPSGAVDKNYIRMPCPMCSAVSVHPVGGGAQPYEVQLEFARLWTMRAQSLGIPPAERGWESIKALVCAEVEKMDGPGRCLIADAPPPTDIPQP